MKRLLTPRTLLRPWRDDDLAPYAALSADPLVMEHYPAPYTRAESEESFARIRAHFERHGFGLWVLEIRDDPGFAGFVGLQIPTFETHFTPCIEAGWRLADKYWGKGYATEAARAALAFAFDELGKDEVVAMTVPGNLRSRRVMEKLGMTRDPADDFDHPRLPAGHPLQRHVLYRIRR